VTSIAALRTRRAPARIVHLGLGAFARAHQAWYTDRAPDAGAWGIAGFTGRSPAAAETLAAQDCVYSVVERGAADSASVVQSIVSAGSGSDAAALAAAVADPAVAIVTLTITEAGYAPGSAALDRLAVALDARRAADAGPLALVPCDNLPGNGAVLRERLLAAARSRAGLADWLGESASFVSTVVDRITPATTADDLALASRLVGADDRAAVVAEPFASWTLAGEFPGGRPDWGALGAEFADEIEPAERRKLWLLNAAHSLLAYRGLESGVATVAEGMADDRLAAEVETLWDEAGTVLPFDDAVLAHARADLRDRFANARIEHRLAQIARDGSQKLGPRVLDPLRSRLDAGMEPGAGQAGAVAAWVRHVVAGRADDDPGAAVIRPDLDGRAPVDQARTVLIALAPDLAGHRVVVDAVADAI
jgi:fructuronate reductase